MLHLEFVRAEMMLQFGGLCLLTALLYTAFLPGEEAWERLDAVRQDIERRREQG
ncbi:MAG TPA: hypothetical protein V6D05_17900 [Stenomitos sp.]